MREQWSIDWPLTILLSRQAMQDFGPRIDDVLRGVPYRYIHLEDGPDNNFGAGADIAFMTREVTGLSSGKTVRSDTLVRFYELMRASPSLCWMQTHSAGADRPIYRELRARDVVVTTASGANAVPVAQMALTGLLALARRLPDLMAAQRSHAWKPLLGDSSPRDLHGQTALVVGLGPIGQEIARLLKALGMLVIGVRRHSSSCPGVDETISFDRIRDVLPRADWVMLACPLTDTTRGLIDASAFELLPMDAHIVNVSRGEVIVEDALIDALKSGRLGGAHLDVVANEPLDPDSVLWAMPNVIITPHTAGHTSGHYRAVGAIFLDNLARWRDGMSLRNTIA